MRERRGLRGKDVERPLLMQWRSRAQAVAPKFSSDTRSEMNVPKNPLASWTMLVATMSVPIAARIDPVVLIEGLPSTAAATPPGSSAPWAA